jgi:histone deacetylase 6
MYDTRIMRSHRTNCHASDETNAEIEAQTDLYEYNSLYVNQHTAKAASLSAGGVVCATKAVVTGKVKNALAIVRPPGHHAEPECCMGFSFYNNVAVATKVVQKELGVKKVLILDW